jgi:RHS repeat-associated protein
MHRLTTEPATPGSPLQDLSYTYDGVSNIKSITDHRPIAANDPSNGTQTFAYDDLYRLTRAEGTGYGAISFQYDAIGNMIFKGSPAAPDPKHIADPLINLGEMTSGGTAGTRNRGVRQPGDPAGPHAITATESGLIYDYDDNGNMVSHAEGDIYEWDFRDRLLRVETADSSSRYVYDESGTRVIKRVLQNGTEEVTWYVNDAFEIREGKDVKYVFAGNRRVARIEGSLIQAGTSTYQTLLFSKGWNFFSLTVEPDDPDITAVLSPIAGKYKEIWRFDAVNQTYLGYDPSSNIFNLIEMHAGIGYAIYVTEDTTLLVQGIRKNNNHSLLAGWNLIGGPAAYSLRPKEAFGDILTQISSVWQFDNLIKKWLNHVPNEPPFLNTLKLVPPGSANWLYLSTNQNFSYLQETKIFFYHPDHIGSSTLVTDTNGVAVERTEYYPFGRLRYENRIDFNSSYKFTGKELDKESGLMYYEARYYDAVIGTFVSVDPLYIWDPVANITKRNKFKVLSNPQNFNTYMYVYSNPLVFIDPEGKKVARKAEADFKAERLKAIESHDLKALYLATIKAKRQLKDEVGDEIFSKAKYSTPEQIEEIASEYRDETVVDYFVGEGVEEIGERLLKNLAKDPKITGTIGFIFISLDVLSSSKILPDEEGAVISTRLRLQEIEKLSKLAKSEIHTLVLSKPLHDSLESRERHRKEMEKIRERIRNKVEENRIKNESLSGIDVD